MAHKIGLNDTQYEPDICGAVDFSFFDEDDSDVERTKGLEENHSEFVVVREKRNHSVVVVTPPSSSSSTTHHSKNSVLCQSSSTSSCCSSRFVEDISCGPSQGGLTKEKEKEEEQDTGRSERSRRCLRLAEGQLESGEEMRNEHRASFGSSTSERGTAGSTSSLEAHEPHIEASGAVMEEHVDPNHHHHHPHHHLLHHHLDVYTSDEWDEEDSSDLSDTDDQDHSDSSDDDDPKSQVDRLIERGTLMYMDGENSNLSSEESSDYDDTDSESDITDVSPLISATASPLGLSPVLPRRTLGTSPLALHDNRDLAVVDFSRHDMISCHDQGYDSQPHCNGSSHSNSDDSTDMTLLLKAVVELEKKQKSSSGSQRGKASPNNRYSNRRYLKNRTNASHHHHPHYHDNHHHQQDNLHHHTHHHNQIVDTTSTPIPIHPIDASPHHSHLRRPPHHHSSHRRKNMSFSNEEVRRIDRDNQILLKKIMSAHTRSARHQSSSNQNHNRTVQRPANSTVNRKREDEKIRRENMILLRKIQEAKPSRDVTASRSPRHRTTHGARPHSSLPATPGSIGASARTA